MGLLSIIRKQKIKDHEVRVLVLGLDNSGKTSIIKRWKHEDWTTISPTMGFEISTLQYQDFTLNLWDIGGQTSLRTFWSNYFDKTNVVVWVVDCMSMERIQESYEELRDKVIQQDRLEAVSLLILMNKIDLLEATKVEETKQQIVGLLELESQLPLEKWQIIAVSAVTGQGTESAIEWIIRQEYEP